MQVSRDMSSVAATLGADSRVSIDLERWTGEVLKAAHHEEAQD